MVQGFERAQAEYEYKMTHPYDCDYEDIEEDETYWSNVDYQMEEMKELEND